MNESSRERRERAIVASDTPLPMTCGESTEVAATVWTRLRTSRRDRFPKQAVAYPATGFSLRHDPTTISVS